MILNEAYRTTARTGAYKAKTSYPRRALSMSGQRFYSPDLGRWVNRDPIGERGGISLQAFVRNAPGCHVDPFGLAPLQRKYVSKLTSALGGGLIYSCYCGWLDGDHMAAGKAVGRSVLRQLEAFLAAGKSTYRVELDFRPFGEKLYHGDVPKDPASEWKLEEASRIAMGYFDTYEGSLLSAVKTIAASIIFEDRPASGYSVEDMPGYYLGVLLGLGVVSFEDIGSICEPVTVEESRLMFGADHTPRINRSRKPMLWSDRDGVCCLTDYAAGVGAAFHDVAVASSMLKVEKPCPCMNLDEGKKAKAEELFNDLVGMGK